MVAFEPGMYGAPGIHEVCGEVRLERGRWVDVEFGESDEAAAAGKELLDAEAEAERLARPLGLDIEPDEANDTLMVGVVGCFPEREPSDSLLGVVFVVPAAIEAILSVSSANGKLYSLLTCRLVLLSGLFPGAGLFSRFALLGLGDFVSLFPFGFGMRVGVGLVDGEVGGEYGEDMMNSSAR